MENIISLAQITCGLTVGSLFSKVPRQMVLEILQFGSTLNIEHYPLQLILVLLDTINDHLVHYVVWDPPLLFNLCDHYQFMIPFERLFEGLIHCIYQIFLCIGLPPYWQMDHDDVLGWQGFQGVGYHLHCPWLLGCDKFLDCLQLLGVEMLEVELVLRVLLGCVDYHTVRVLQTLSMSPGEPKSDLGEHWDHGHIHTLTRIVVIPQTLLAHAARKNSSHHLIIIGTTQITQSIDIIWNMGR